MSIDDQANMNTGGKARDHYQSGDVFGQYSIIRLLGRGAMGEVYAVRHRVLGSVHAIKLISRKVLSSDTAVERFKREAKAMAQLRHPGIVHVDDFGETDGRYWLRMELVGGSDADEGAGLTLGEKLKAANGKLNENEVREILQQILKALAYAHGEGVVHRDLKPANILMESSGTLKIADFGLVRFVGEKWLQSQVQLTVVQSMIDPDATLVDNRGPLSEEETLVGDSKSGTSRRAGSSTRALMGTYAFMSPEQRRGEEADHRSDLYAVGLIAYQMLTGESQGFLPPSELVEGLDGAWDRWIIRATHPRLEHRFSGASDMHDAIPDLHTGSEHRKPIKGASDKHKGILNPNQRTPSVEAVLKSKEAPKSKTVSAASEHPPTTAEMPEFGKSLRCFLGSGDHIDLVWIEPGEFLMGSPKKITKGGFLGIGAEVLQEGETGRYANEGPQTRVRLSKGYWLGKTPVTQDHWQTLMGSNPSHFKGSNLPVEEVSWNDAMNFCKRLNDAERRAGRLPAGYTYTLPSEAQWEYAGQATSTSSGQATSTSSGQVGATTRFYTGDSDSDLERAGWFRGNSGGSTKPLGDKVANAWGLFDMHGNVWEWTRSWYGNYPGGSVVDYEGPASGSYRVARGGSWGNPAQYCRSALRGGGAPGNRGNNLGFRLALALTLN